MEDLEKLIGSLNIPKQILDKSEALLKALFGPSLEEASGLVADQIRLRRFKNQVKIFAHAQEYLRKHNLDPKKISLKTLAPLIEYSSLEENELLQDKWAKLIANLVTADNQVLLEQNVIEILKTVTPSEAQLLDFIYQTVQKKRQDLTEKYKPQSTKYKLTSFSLRINEIIVGTKHSQENLDAFISNLTALGAIKWDVPDVEVGVSKSRPIHNPREMNMYDDDDFDVDVDVSEPKSIFLTELGVKFITLCTSPPGQHITQSK